MASTSRREGHYSSKLAGRHYGQVAVLSTIKEAWRSTPSKVLGGSLGLPGESQGVILRRS